MTTPIPLASGRVHASQARLRLRPLNRRKLLRQERHPQSKPAHREPQPQRIHQALAMQFTYSPPHVRLSYLNSERERLQVHHPAVTLSLGQNTENMGRDVLGRHHDDRKLPDVLNVCTVCGEDFLFRYLGTCPLPLKCASLLFVELPHVLNYPLANLSGTTLTPGTLLFALASFFLARFGAKYIAIAVREGLTRRGHPVGVAAATAQITRYAIVFVAFAIALNSVGINVNALLAGSAALLVGVGLGLQNVTSNFVSGIALLIEQPIKKGDTIRLGDITGTVSAIGLRATRIVTREEATLIVPNNEIVMSRVLNLSIPTSKLRLRVRVGVAYDSDVKLVMETMLEVANNHAEVLETPAADVRLEGFGESSLDFALLCWIPDAPNDDEVASDLRLAIVEAFRERGVEIPFPQHDLRVYPAAPSPAAESKSRKLTPTPFA